MVIMTQESKIKRGQSIVGEVHTARQTLDNPGRYGVDKNNETFSPDIIAGENFKVLSYDEVTNEYKLLNLSSETPEAWFTVSDDELDYILY